MSQTILYARVSTTEQTIEHQEAQAVAAGFQIDEVIADDGASGVSKRLRDRDEGKRLYDPLTLRKGDVLVVRWVDRLGRNYEDVTEAIRYFMKRGVVIRTVINNMTFDGAVTAPMQEAVRDALIGFMAATAQAQAETTKEAQKAGIAHHKEVSPEKFKGRKPAFSRDQFEEVRSLLAAGQSHSAVAKSTGVNRNAVIRIAKDPAKAEAGLLRWGL